MVKLGRRLFLGEAMFYFNQILHAVDYLHTLPTPVIHKDIKGEISLSIQGSIFLFSTESSAMQVSLMVYFPGYKFGLPGQKGRIIERLVIIVCNLSI